MLQGRGPGDRLQTDPVELAPLVELSPAFSTNGWGTHKLLLKLLSTYAYQSASIMNQFHLGEGLVMRSGKGTVT